MTLEDIEKLCDEATPGPWYYENCGTSIYTTHAHQMLNKQYLPTRMEIRSAIPGDMKFIAASRDLLPKLVKIIKAARGISPHDDYSDKNYLLFIKLLEELQDL